MDLPDPLMDLTVPRSLLESRRGGYTGLGLVVDGNKDILEKLQSDAFDCLCKLEMNLPESYKEMKLHVGCFREKRQRIFDHLPQGVSNETLGRAFEFHGDMSHFEMKAEGCNDHPPFTSEFESGKSKEHSKQWYEQALYLFPEAGHLYLKMARSVEPDRNVRKLYFTVKALMAKREDLTAKTLLRRMRDETDKKVIAQPPDPLKQFDQEFVHEYCTLLFRPQERRGGDPRGRSKTIHSKLRVLLDDPSQTTSEYWSSSATEMAICSISLLLQPCARARNRGVFTRFMEEHTVSELSPTDPFIYGRDFAIQTLATFVVCQNENAKHQHILAWLVFLDYLTQDTTRTLFLRHYLQKDIPWKELSQCINAISRQPSVTPGSLLHTEHRFPAGTAAPTENELFFRGLSWAYGVLPENCVSYGSFRKAEAALSRQLEHLRNNSLENSILMKRRIQFLAQRVQGNGEIPLTINPNTSIRATGIWNSRQRFIKLFFLLISFSVAVHVMFSPSQ